MGKRKQNKTRKLRTKSKNKNKTNSLKNKSHQYIDGLLKGFSSKDINTEDLKSESPQVISYVFFEPLDCHMLVKNYMVFLFPLT